MPYTPESLEQAITDLLPHWRLAFERVQANERAIIHCWMNDVPRDSESAEIVTEAWRDLNKRGMYNFTPDEVTTQ